MASTISAGTTTTTALVYTADTSGVLQFQTNGTTTAVTIDTSQNVGVNTTNPSAYGKLVVSGGGFTQLATLALPSTSGSTRSDFTRVLDVAGSRSLDSGVSSSGSWVQSRDKNDYSVNYNLLLQPNGGNVGISTSSPSHLLTVNQGSSSTTGLLISGNSSPGLNITETSSSNNLFLGADSSAIYVSAQTSTPLVFRTNSTEYMRLDTSGNLLVGTTSAFNSSKISSNGDIEAHGNFKTHYASSGSLTNGSSLTLMSYPSGSYGAQLDGILTVECRDDSGGNLSTTTYLVSAYGGSGAAFTAQTTAVYGAGQSFSIGSTAVSGALTIYITNTSGRTATSVNFTFLGMKGGGNITYAF